MEQLNPTIGHVARQMLGNFTIRERADGVRFWDLKEDVDWQHQIVMESYGRRMLSQDAYATVVKLLVEIHVASNSDEAVEFLYDVEPYGEVEELTSWLNASSDNLHYLTSVLRERAYLDGMAALSDAHRLFLFDVGHNLIDAIQQYIGVETLPVAAVV